MKRTQLLSIAAVCAMAIASAACSSSSSPTPTPSGPTVSSVTGTTLSATGATSDATIATTGTTGVSGSAATPLTVTFSETMDATTLSNLTVTCGGEAVVGGSASPSTNATTYTLTAPATGLPPLTSCEFGFPATITDADGNALTATTYTFTTGCSTNDNFAIDTVTGGCWSTAAVTPTPAISSGTLGFTFAAPATDTFPPNTPAAYKTFASISTGLAATAKVTTSNTTGQDLCILTVSTDTTFVMSAFVGIEQDTDTAGQMGSILGGTPTVAPIPGGTGDYYCLAVATDGSVTVGQAADAATCTPDQAIAGVTVPTTGSAVLALTSLNGDTTSITCTFDDFTVTNAAATAGVTATAPLYEY